MHLDVGMGTGEILLGVIYSSNTFSCFMLPNTRIISGRVGFLWLMLPNTRIISDRVGFLWLMLPNTRIISGRVGFLWLMLPNTRIISGCVGLLWLVSVLLYPYHVPSAIRFVADC